MAYPWLAIMGDDGIPLIEATLLDLLPEGWRGLVLDMSYCIARALDNHGISRDKYKVADAKEKWYALSWFSYIDDWDDLNEIVNVPDDVLAIEREYEIKSKNVCMMCGKNKRVDELVCKECKNKL